MPDSIASKRRSRRCSLLLASLVSAAPLALPLSADQPLEKRHHPVLNQPIANQPVAKQPVPRRLPRVSLDSPGAPDLRGMGAVGASVQPCSAEFDALVDSWFSDPVENESETAPPTRWLRSTSSSAAAEVARRLVGQATREFEVGAWLSAETSAWDAVRWAAESVDLAARERGEEGAIGSLQNLQFARDAIREARDFSGVYGPLDGDAIQRMALSHQTDVLDGESIAGVTATDASDRYLDHARVLLAPIARESLEAAQGMDLLAAIYLGRADAKTLPSSTALCLRRAALQGQPGNASLACRLGMHLADVGLLAEAQWALEHSLAIENDPTTANALVQVLRRSGQHDQAVRLLAQVQTQVNGPSRLAASQSAVAGSGGATPASGPEIRVPEILELSPDEFASISQPVIPFERTDRSIQATPVSATLSSQAASVAEQESVASIQSAADDQEEKPGMIRRFFGSFKRIW